MLDNNEARLIRLEESLQRIKEDGGDIKLAIHNISLSLQRLQQTLAENQAAERQNRKEIDDFTLRVRALERDGNLIKGGLILLSVVALSAISWVFGSINDIEKRVTMNTANIAAYTRYPQDAKP